MMDSADGNIGRILQERREQLGRTLQDAEDQTRIRKTYLESIENNRFSELPGQAYVKGFIRVYAAYLGLKSTPLLALLGDFQSPPSEQQDAAPVVAEKRPGPRADQAAGGDWRKFILAFVLVLAVGCLFYFLVAVISDEQQLVDSAPQGVADGVKQAEPAKPQPAPAEPQAAAAEPARPDAPEAVVPVRDTAQPAPGTGQPARESESWPAIPPDGGSLRMLALADGSLIIKVDARKPQQYELHDGLDLTWKVKQEVQVEFAITDVARFWLNGQEIDIAGHQSFVLKTAAE